MPGLAQRNDQFTNGSPSPIYSLSSPLPNGGGGGGGGFWSKHRDDVSYNQLQKFWSELTPQARQKLLRIDKQTLFEQARKNMYCSRCNGLLLEGFLQIVMYVKSLKQEGTGGQLSCNRSRASKNQKDGVSSITYGCHDEIPDLSVHPWGGLTITREGSLTLIDCYLYCKSLKGLQNVFDSARARERERELLYPDACGGGGRGWISQGMPSYGRGHGTRETCALHTARLSCDTLVDFWSALGEETRQSLLRMKEEDFIERLMYRFDSKRFCRDCRRNVIREFKELKELKRMRREPCCTNWFCVADTTFQYEVSDGTVQADWRHTFADTVGTYHHFEWAVGTGEGKCDILEFENVGMNGSVKVDGLDLGGLSACFITLRAWKLDGRCTELSVKAHALKGQQCVHCRLIVGDGYVTITRGESIRRFFEHAEEAEEEEDDDSMDKDGNELDGECSRPQKHAKSPELAREFLLDAATVIFKEQVEKAFREGTARQNAHSIFVCLALKLLEERVHVACKDIITLEKQMKLLEEEEKEKRDEEERKERRRTKEREKKMRRKERLKGKDKDNDKKFSEANQTPDDIVLNEDSSLTVNEEPNSSISCKDSVSEAGDDILSRPGSPDISDEQFQNDFIVSKIEDHCYDSPDGEISNGKSGTDSFTVEQSKFSRRRLKFTREVQLDASLKWSDRRRYAAVSDGASVVNRSEPRCNGDNFETPSRGINGSNRQLRVTGPKSNGRHGGSKFSEKFLSPSNRMSDRYDFHSCSCNKNTQYRAKVEPHVSAARVGWETKTASKSEAALDMSKQFYRGNKHNQVEHMRDSCVRPKSKVNSGDNSGTDLLHPKKIWEPIEPLKKYPRSNSDSDVTLRASAFKAEDKTMKLSGDICKGEVGVNSGVIDEDNNLKQSRKSSMGDVSCQNGFHAGAQDSRNSPQATYEEIGICSVSSVLNSIDSTSNGISDSTVSSSTNSDNCSSCLSEGDSNTTSSNHGNQESFSTSDSEDASQKSAEKETSLSIQNGFQECHEFGMENDQNVKRGESMESRALTGPLLNGVGSNILGNPSTNIAQSFDNGLSAVSVGSQHYGMLSTLHNQNVPFSVFQAPSMGYYNQSPVSWPAAPTNGMMPFPHPNNYLYAGHLGYGMNGNTGLCMPYSHVQHVPPPLFTPGPVPIYQPPVINTEERTQISNPVVQESPSEANTVSADPSGMYSMQAPPSGERAQDDNSGNVQRIYDGFSLFHYSGPHDKPPGCEQNVGDLPLNCSDHNENDQACNKKEATIEEYNLFATSNGIRFSFFL